MRERFELDVRLAPDEAARRIERAIRERPKRAFGLIKVAPEFVGVVREQEFEVWERHQHATHLRGRVRGRRSGSRVEGSLFLTRRSIILLVLLFALIGVGAWGFSGLAGDPLPRALLAIPAAALMLAFYLYVAARQRRQLRAFFARIFADVSG